MRVVYLTAGAAGMYCGSCMHDNSLARAMIAEGVDTLLVPTYTPIRTDETDVSVDKVFFGGVNIYLQQLAPWLKYTPRWLDQFLNSPKLIRWVASRGMETSPKQLGALTVSMLKGRQGNQRKEVERLCDWLAREIKPDALVLTNMLIAGFVPELKKRLKVPVAVTLQGDDIFLDYLPEPFRQQTIEMMQQLVGGIDAFIAHSQDYGQRMAAVFRIPAEKLRITPLAIDTTPFHQDVNANRSMPDAPTVGYMARLAPEKGLHLLVDAFVKLHEDKAMRSTRLRIAGWLGPSNQDYWEKQKQKISAAGLSEVVSYEGEIDHRHKVNFMHGIDVLCVPTTYRDPKGLFALEALASGTPVIVPSHGAFPEMLQRLGGGWLVSPDNVDEIAEKLRWIFTNREESARIGKEAWPAVFKHADIRIMARQTIEILKDLQTT